MVCQTDAFYDIFSYDPQGDFLMQMHSHIFFLSSLLTHKENVFF